MVTVENIAFINALIATDDVLDATIAEFIPDNIIEEINNQEEFEIPQGTVEDKVYATLKRTNDVTNDNSTLIDVTLKFGEHDSFKMAYVIHNEDFNGITEKSIEAGISHFKDYFFKSDITRWMLRNKSQPVMYRPLNFVDDGTVPMAILKTPYGEPNLLDSLFAEIRELSYVKSAFFGGTDELNKAIKATDDPDAVMINCIVILKDGSEDNVQIPLTKAQWNHKEVQRNVFDQLERLVADLNAVLKKPE